MSDIQISQRTLTPKEFVAFGLNVVAFVKPVRIRGVTGYGIFAADGTPLTVLTERETAVAAIRQNNMEPLSVH
ncbi:DUF1150 family protein [Azospirillaceae bacterium]